MTSLLGQHSGNISSAITNSNISVEFRHSATLKINDAFLHLIKNENKICVYMPKNSWQVPLQLDKEDLGGKNFYYLSPNSNSKNILFKKYSGNSSKLFGINNNSDLTPEHLVGINLVFIPCMAVSKDGIRLGDKGDYYTQVITQLKKTNPKIKVIGVCFSNQNLPYIARGESTMKVDAILTEKGLSHFDSNKGLKYF